MKQMLYLLVIICTLNTNAQNTLPKNQCIAEEYISESPMQICFQYPYAPESSAYNIISDKYENHVRRIMLVGEDRKSTMFVNLRKENNFRPVDAIINFIKYHPDKQYKTQALEAPIKDVKIGKYSGRSVQFVYENKQQFIRAGIINDTTSILVYGYRPNDDLKYVDIILSKLEFKDNTDTIIYDFLYDFMPYLPEVSSKEEESKFLSNIFTFKVNYDRAKNKPVKQYINCFIDKSGRIHLSDDSFMFNLSYIQDEIEDKLEKLPRFVPGRRKNGDIVSVKYYIEATFIYDEKGPTMYDDSKLLRDMQEMKYSDPTKPLQLTKPSIIGGSWRSTVH